MGFWVGEDRDRLYRTRKPEIETDESLIATKTYTYVYDNLF